MAMKVQECCCGCSLRTGTIIIALLLLVCSVLTLPLSSVKLYYISTVVDDQRDTFVEFQKQLLGIYDGNEDAKVALICKIASDALLSILNALLLIGVLKEKRILVAIWLVAYSVICGLCFLVFVISFFQYAIDPALLFGVGISVGLYFYFLLVVRSFHNSPEAGYNRQQNAAYVFDIENCNIKRKPLENFIQ